MADQTERLGLAKPDDNSDNWGDGYRAAMDSIDTHPGVRVVWELSEVAAPWVGQTVFEASTATLVAWTGVEWKVSSGDGGEVPEPAPTFYRHVQGVPASVWTINHNLGFFPGGIMVRDSSGDLHEGQIEYLDINTVRISFFAAGVPASFSGEAFIS